MAALTKSLSQTTTPAVSGLPGSPGFVGSPAVPSYYRTDVVVVPAVPGIKIGTLYFINNAWTLDQSTPPVPPHVLNQIYIIPQRSVYAAGTPATTKTVLTFVPAVPAVAAIPPTPAVAAQAAQIGVNFNLGWNSGAISQKVCFGDMTLAVSVTAASVGVVAGLNDVNLGVDYEEIKYGFYFTHGTYTVYELGVAMSGIASAASSDVFKVTRLGGVVKYYKNDALVYTSLIPSTGPLFADSSLYTGNDTISFASFTDVIGPGKSAGSLLPVSGQSSNKSYSSSAGSLLPFRTSRNFSIGKLRALIGRASNKPYGSAVGKMLPIAGGANKLTPITASALGTLLPFQGTSRVITGTLGNSTGSLLPFTGVSSNRPYAYSAGSIAGFSGYAETFAKLSGYATITIPRVTLRATGHDSTGENAASVALPPVTVTAYCGGFAQLVLPAIKVTVAATIVNVGRAKIKLPAIIVTASATATGSGTAHLSISQNLLHVVGYSGAVLSVSTGVISLQALGTSGGVGKATLILPRLSVVTSATARNHGGAVVVLPALRIVVGAAGQIKLPGLFLVALGTDTVTAAFEAYSVNLKHVPRVGANEAAIDEVTHYTNFPFVRIVRFENSYFGVAADGLYLLGGTTDNSAAITCKFNTHITDFGAAEKKTIVSARVGGRFGPAATVTLHAGETGQTAYAYTTPRSQLAQNYREKFGRGIKNRYFGVEISTADELEIDQLEFEINKLTRRI